MVEEPEDSDDGEVETASWDDDAELQARIWNGFLREIKGIADSVYEDEYISRPTVTQSQIKRMTLAIQTRPKSLSHDVKSHLQEINN